MNIVARANCCALSVLCLFFLVYPLSVVTTILAGLSLSFPWNLNFAIFICKSRLLSRIPLSRVWSVLCLDVYDDDVFCLFSFLVDSVLLGNYLFYVQSRRNVQQSIINLPSYKMCLNTLLFWVFGSLHEHPRVNHGRFTGIAMYMWYWATDHIVRREYDDRRIEFTTSEGINEAIRIDWRCTVESLKWPWREGNGRWVGFTTKCIKQVINTSRSLPTWGYMEPEFMRNVGSILVRGHNYKVCNKLNWGLRSGS